MNIKNRLLFIAGFAITGTACTALAPMGLIEAFTPDYISQSALPAPPSQAELRYDAMIASNECWNGEAPDPEIYPTRAWIDGELRGKWWTNKALTELFTDQLYVINAFCK